MSKNIYITEGRRGRRFGSVQRLKTPLQGGGECFWVPEDDVQTDHLFANENKVYLPENYGFSGASVHVVDGHFDDLDVNDNGAYWPDFAGTGLYPPETDYNGYSKVSVNVPANKQDTFMDSVVVGTELNPNYDYSWVVMLGYNGYQEYESSDPGIWHTRIQYFYQSKFPPYIHRYTTSGGAERTVVCGYVFGEDSMIANVNYDFEDIQPEHREIETWEWLKHLYVRQCKLIINDNINSSGCIGWDVIRSEADRETGEDVLNVNSNSSYSYTNQVTIQSVKGHLGYYCHQQHMRLFKRTSSWSDPTTPALETGVRGPRACQKKKTAPCSYGWTTVAKSGVCDYRIIHGEPFQSGAEWLAYCQAHSISVNG